MKKEGNEEEIRAHINKVLEEEIEREQKRIEAISETLKYAIESDLKIELIISNPPTHVLSKATASPEKIENGYLWTTTDGGSKIKIELSRVERVRIIDGLKT
jgi:hypothetical protein